MKGRPCRPQVRERASSRIGARRCTAAQVVSNFRVRRRKNRRGSKGPGMADAPGVYGFAAYLPRLVAPVRIGTYADAQVFVRRWTIRDKDTAVRSEEHTSELQSHSLISD